MGLETINYAYKSKDDVLTILDKYAKVKQVRFLSNSNMVLGGKIVGLIWK